MSGERVCFGVVSPVRNATSESFIRAQIDGLSGQTVEIWGSPRPLFSGGGEPILSGMPSLLGRVLRAFTGMKSYRAGGVVGRRLPTALYDKQLSAFLQRSAVSVILAEYGPTGVVVMEGCRRSKTPLVVHFHGYDAYQYETLDRFQQPYRRLFAAAKRTIAVSKDMVRKLESLGAPSERIVYNPYGVDTTIFRGAQPAAANPNLLALGRFVEKKAPHLTLRAFAIVHREEPRSRLTMLGEGPLLPQCVSLAKDLQIDNSVSFPGTVDHNEVVGWMQRSRCFVQHSLRARNGDSEGTPVAVLEASSCGLPIVSTKHCGIIDAVRDGVSGFLVEEGDIDGMAHCMLRLTGDPVLAAEMGTAGRRHIEANYTLQQSVERLRSVLIEVAGGA